MPQTYIQSSSLKPGIVTSLVLATLIFGVSSGAAQEFQTEQEDTEVVLAPDAFSPYAGRNFPTRPLWGDSHLHTEVSVDAGTMNRLSQADAFRFARGEEVTTTHGLRAKLSRPLDWLVVSDHAEMYGLMPQLLAGDVQVLASEQGRIWYEALTAGDPQLAFNTAMEIVASLSGDEPPIDNPKAIKHAWENYLKTAEQFNEPGVFTAIIGYEYTTEGANNLHRNVLFRDGPLRASQTRPFSQYDSKNPEDLWAFLAEYEERTGGEVLAIAHNGNLSNGRMFSMNAYDGSALTEEIASMRARFEPLYEVTQIKGDGEAHPFLSPDDAFADHDTWDAANLNGTEVKTPDMLAGEYAREALKRGMQIEADLGINPFKFGMVGATDSHTAMATAQEDNFFGKHSGVEPEPNRWEHLVIEAPDPELSIFGWKQAAGGLGAVWATENTREAIFDAMMRKETYATTGSRIGVRFFGGYNFTEEDALSRLPADAGYRKGVPMGGNIGAASDGKSPTFLVAALKDPISGNLDRIQIVKGWLDPETGETSEKIFDVVWSGDRVPDANGILPDVGNTVDVANATWTNSIGAPELVAVWEDPDFDPLMPAFYYTRVIEIPTPRWTAYEANRFGVEMPDYVPMVTTERAYTSPIWYTPG
ncbi:DUF3604 domain-containing protein [Ruegeria atlantica]|uniref:DUF3604 domain-containing protein n=1 Tax=Ruegeria atlantica TaxID=81569 RepID=A0A0P1E2W6_9RHOB|nr:DUF3604 domain-containing protein [Ruegeria atlantica]CUH42595.1 hypothetical protein RUM4293_01483 [Ruegeria atlantica]